MQNARKDISTISKRPTLQMVAEYTGVSRGTVDRVLNNRSHVKAEVRTRVLKALEELRYLPRRRLMLSPINQLSSTPLILGVLLPGWAAHCRVDELNILTGWQARTDPYIIQ